MDNLTEKELKAVFDVVNVYEPEDISHVYPEMATDEFMEDIKSAWKKILKNLDTIKQNWENTIMETITKTEIVECIISEIDFLDNYQLLRLYREVYGDINEEQVDWEE